MSILRAAVLTNAGKPPRPGRPEPVRIARLAPNRAGEQHLVRRLVFVAFFLEVGLLLVVMPWWPALWDQNYFTDAWPALRPILGNNFVRGAITGLGLVNIAAGVADLAGVFAARPSSSSGPPEAADGAGPTEWSGPS